MQRVRESSLESKFTNQQREFIDTFVGASFKERALRASGKGLCKECGKITPYMGKLNFEVYCSTECSIASKRDNRHNQIYDELKNAKFIPLSNVEEIVDVRNELEYKCSRGHVNRHSIFHLRYQLEYKCPTCRDEDKTQNLLLKRDEKKRKLVEERDIAKDLRKLQTIKDREEKHSQLIGNRSGRMCHHCGDFTKYRLFPNKTISDKDCLYAPAYCNDECKQNFFESRRKNTIESRLSAIKSKKPWINPTYIGEFVKQKFKFDGCGHELELNYKNVSSFDHLYNDDLKRCPRCSSFESSYNKRMIQFLESKNVNIIKNDRVVLGNRSEIDVYLPDHKIGIELNGVWWHSDVYKHDNYHLLKTETAKLQNVKLIQIFSDEIDEKWEVVQSRLSAMIGKTKKIYARQCEIKEIPSVVKQDFLERCHIQGDTGAKIKLGLYHGPSLVAVMTFRKPRDQFMQKKYEWELIRYASELNTTVVGGAGKLLKYFEKVYNPKSLFTYADYRWSYGELYQILGFSFVRKSAPGYKYVIGNKRESRVNYRKQTILESNPNIDSSLTEREIMRSMGYPQIYDCGQLVYEKLYI